MALPWGQSLQHSFISSTEPEETGEVGEGGEGRWGDG